MSYKNLIEIRNITKDLKHKISVSTNQKIVYLLIDYKNGRFTIERNYPNNFLGWPILERECKKFNSDEKVKEYLGLKEIK